MEKIPQKNKFTRPTVVLKHQKILKNLTENGGNMSKAIKDTGLYSQEIIDNPQKVLNSVSWQELMEQELPDADLSLKHKELLNSTRLDHMIFPLGPKGEDDINFSGAIPNKESKIEKYVERTTLTDEEIKTMLLEVNCKVRRIVHGETARHVYFWSYDNKARKEALEMAYKLKGRFGTEVAIKPAYSNTYNFIFSGPMQDKIKVIEGEIKQMLIKPNVKEN